jgi:AraC-like DNA-binding protein/ligand-binding sensor protein
MSVLSYVIHSEDIEQILEIVYDVLQIGVSFYDKDFNELPFIFQGHCAPYCHMNRKKAAFFATCRKTDRKYFDMAHKTGNIQVYRCHAGLLDGFVPIFDDDGLFLGGFIFGQVRPSGMKNPHPKGSELASLFDVLPQADEKKLMQIGRLLKLTTELIVNKRMIEFRRLGWSAQIREYIDTHCHTKITLDHLAELVGKSPSFLTHHFRQELGMSLSEYIKKRKMENAVACLKSGMQVGQVAQRLGYYDAYHFSKAFKQHFGRSPKEYKN